MVSCEQIPTRCLDVNRFVISDPDDLSGIREQMANWQSLDRMIFDIDVSSVELRLEHLRRLLSFAEQIFLVVTPMCATKILPQLKTVLAESPEWKEKLNTIWVLDESEDLAPLNPELLHSVHRDFKIKTGSSTDSFQHTPFPGDRAGRAFAAGCSNRSGAGWRRCQRHVSSGRASSI